MANGLSVKQIPYFHWASVSRNADHDALVAWPAERPMETTYLMSTQLRSPQCAAERLGVSVKTLQGYVSDGELRYISVGRGAKKVRRKFTDEDIDDFIERRAQRDMPCRSTGTGTARSTTTTSSSKVIGFTALRDARASEKLKPSSAPRRRRANQQVRAPQAIAVSTQLDDVAGRYWHEIGQHHAGADTT